MSPGSTPLSATVVDSPHLTGALLNGKSKLSLAPKPNTEDLRKEVEAMMASFQPVEQPIVLHIPPSTASPVKATVKSEGYPQVVAAIPVTASSNGLLTAATSSNGHMPITSLPAIVLSAVASATVASVQAKVLQARNNQPQNHNGNHAVTRGRVHRSNYVVF